MRLKLYNLPTSQVSVLSGLPSCSILVQKFQGFSLGALGQRISLFEGYAGGCLFHYIVFYFLSKSTFSEELATMTVQNKLKE